MSYKEYIMKIFTHSSGQSVEIDGANIYYEEIGNKDKPVLLMLHGGYESIENLNSMAAYLSEDFRIIGIDSRGHGKSTLGNKKLTYEQLQFDAETILKQLNIDIVNIIGFSDGGIVAYRIAANNNIKVNKLITVGSSWKNDDIEAVEDILKAVTPETAKEYFPENVKDYHRLNPEQNFDALNQFIVAMETDKTETGHPNEKVKNISAETLLIRGDNDFLVSSESLAELKTEIKGSSFLNVPFAEHVVHEEQPQVIEIILKQFFNI